METTVSNLQILGAAESAVKAALPKTLVAQWSERFVTACPEDLSFSQLDRKLGWLSRKLGCAVLFVSMFDGDVLSLALYVSGKRTAIGERIYLSTGRNEEAFRRRCAGRGRKQEKAARFPPMHRTAKTGRAAGV